MLKMPEQLKTECEQLHKYLIERLKHNWRQATWETKYAGRIRRYGLEDCRTAVDGFCSQLWYVEQHSQDAPDLIFRNDRQLEKFLAVGKKLRRVTESDEDRKARADVLTEKQASIRERLGKEHPAAQYRLSKLLAPLEDEVAPHSWKVWIEPLRYAGKEGDAVVLYHENASWVQEYYGVMISEALKRPVKIVSEVEI